MTAGFQRGDGRLSPAEPELSRLGRDALKRNAAFRAEQSDPFSYDASERCD